MPQSQKQYSNNARVHYTVHNQPTHTHNPTPPNNSKAEPQARQPGRTTPEPRQHATPTRTNHARGTHHHPNQAATGVFPMPTTDNQPHPRATHPRDTTSRPFSARTAPQPAQTHQQPRQPRPGSHPHTIPILRKEVIQPHLPVRLPCYDFVPITSPTFDRSP